MHNRNIEKIQVMKKKLIKYNKIYYLRKEVGITIKSKEQVVSLNQLEIATVRAEISAVCKFRGFRGHLLIQRKFNL